MRLIRVGYIFNKVALDTFDYLYPVSFCWCLTMMCKIVLQKIGFASSTLPFYLNDAIFLEKGSGFSLFWFEFHFARVFVKRGVQNSYLRNLEYSSDMSK
jgi:hypothetical protein